MLKFNSDDAKDLSGSLSQCKSVYSHEWEQVQRNWQDLERTWYDYHHDKFSVTFEPVLRSYHDSIKQLNHHISQLERFTDVAEAIQESLPDISSANFNSNHSNPLASNPVSPIDSALPTIPPNILPIALLLGFLICDAKIIYADDDEFRMSALRENPASNRYSKPIFQPLGDVGEKVVLDMLRKELGPDSDEKIHIKKRLPHFTGNDQEPDFYIPAHGTFPETIVDAKAWKSLNYKSIATVINKYCDLDCLSTDKGGEIRLYFPSDIFDDTVTSNIAITQILQGIRKDKKNITIKILSMEERHSTLTSRVKMIKMLFQMCCITGTR
jgi:predicted transcriptional regulator